MTLRAFGVLQHLSTDQSFSYLTLTVFTRGRGACFKGRRRRGVFGATFGHPETQRKVMTPSGFTLQHSCGHSGCGGLHLHFNGLRLWRHSKSGFHGVGVSAGCFRIYRTATKPAQQRYLVWGRHNIHVRSYCHTTRHLDTTSQLCNIDYYHGREAAVPQLSCHDRWLCVDRRTGTGRTN
jgi:hypothetical protein